MDKGCDGAMAAALMGDDVFMAAIDNADPDTFGCNCSNCETYYVGRWSGDGAPPKVACPNCKTSKASLESPALGSGPEAIYL